MRVLLVSHRFPPDAVAGVERITQSLASDLTKLGDQVEVFTRAHRSDEPTIREFKERLPNGTIILGR